jgi:hypothetical protein
MFVQALLVLCAFVLDGEYDRDRYRRVLLEVSLERLACGTARSTDEDDVVWLAQLLSSPRAPLEIHDRLARDKRLSPKLEAALWPLVVDELVRRGRFAEATRTWRPPITAANELVPDLLECLYPLPGACGTVRYAKLQSVRERISRLESYYCACVRDGQTEAVATLERELTAGLNDLRVYAMFARASVRAGDCARARAHLARIERRIDDEQLPCLAAAWLVETRAVVANCR